MHSRKAKPPAKFGQSYVSGGDVPVALLKQARRSGQLNLSNRDLKVVPATVWHLNSEPVSDQAGGGGAAFDTDDKWWDQTDLIKLILASNELTELSEDIALLPALNVLDVHNNQLTKVPMAIAELKQLTRLILSHNQLTDLGEGLGSLVNMQCLRLDHNQLHNLHDNISSLTHLEQLDISYNHLSTLPVAIENLQLLRQLIVDHNQLTELPAGMKSLQEVTAGHNKITTTHFSNCPKLERLDLKNNLISEFPSILPGASMKELYLGGNKITSIPGDRLLPLVALVMLDLRDNKISSIPGQMASLERLERLDLSNNEITSLPYVMGKLQYLKSLGLDGNPLKSIRRDIINRGTLEILKHLRSRLVEGDDIIDDNISLPVLPPSDKLVYSGKKTSSIPDQFWDHPNTIAVTIVDLSQNHFTSLPDKLILFTHMCELYLSSNKLALLPAAVGSLTHLTILDLRSNHLISLPTELAGCQQLREIFLSMNKFKSLPEVVYSLKRLENVFASDNQISDINVAGLLQLSMIACLDLQNNDITHVPPQLGNVTTLRSLQLSGNPFRQPRANILAKGTPALLAYLRDRIPT